MIHHRCKGVIRAQRLQALRFERVLLHARDDHGAEEAAGEEVVGDENERDAEDEEDAGDQGVDGGRSRVSVIEALDRSHLGVTQGRKEEATKVRGWRGALSAAKTCAARAARDLEG